MAETKQTTTDEPIQAPRKAKIHDTIIYTAVDGIERPAIITAPIQGHPNGGAAIVVFATAYGDPATDFMRDVPMGVKGFRHSWRFA